MKLTTVDLFAGLGGLSQGFVQAGFTPLFTNDFEKEQLETYAANHPSAQLSDDDVRQISGESILKRIGLRRGELDVVLGGPPCQGFSTYGQRRIDDKRNRLFLEFARIIDELQPRAFVMENVVGLLSMEGGALVEEILETFQKKLRYATTMMMLDAVNFGVPQFRRRVFFVGLRGTQTAPSYPTPTHVSGSRCQEEAKEQQAWFFDVTDLSKQILSQDDLLNFLSRFPDQLEPAVTVRDAISDLPERAFQPRESDLTMPYPAIERGTYAARMKGTCDTLMNHAAKRHLLRRSIRTALIDQGDYGNNVLSRLRERGIPESVMAHITNGTFTEAELHSIRDVDKSIESELLQQLRNGQLEFHEVQDKVQSRGFANKYRKLHWDEPSHTLVAHMARDCSDFIHPELNRPITVREAARLQSFPDDYQFRSSHFRQLRGIGNAVPPLLAEAMARHVAAQLAKTDAANSENQREQQYQPLSL